MREYPSMKLKRLNALIVSAALASGCGSGGGGGGGADGGQPIVQSPQPPPAVSACSLRARQDWAAGQLREFYLFPETLPASLDPTPFTSVDTYIDALTSTARSQRRDRFFTYLTSIREENAFFEAGATAGFGVRLVTDAVGRRSLVAEAFEGAPALAAGIDRGTELLAIGADAASLRSVAEIIAAEGPSGVVNALGPNTAGTTRTLRVADRAGAVRDVTLAKADFALSPVSPRYGAQVIEDGGRQVGYLNLRTFISTADPALREAFARFRARGVTEVVVDFRYNGGGLVSIAELINDLLGGDRAGGDVSSFITYRPEKVSENRTRFFTPQAQSIAPMRLAFIGTASTASASEQVINSTLPYLRDRVALIGTNTFGKPVGQIARDRSECDDRLRVVAFETQNAARQGGYYNGLAGSVAASCRATDDLARPLGDPQEASTRQALDFLAGRPCDPISLEPVSARASAGPDEGELGATRRQGLLTPERPTPAQREVPGLF